MQGEVNVCEELSVLVDLELSHFFGNDMSHLLVDLECYFTFLTDSSREFISGHGGQLILMVRVS